mgnify:FL=1
MIKQKKPELLDDQIRSLQWAIGELSKQKQSLNEKISASRMREETEEIIQEVNAQRKALGKRISALQEGLEKSSAVGTDQEPDLQDEIFGVEGKLEVARERLKVLEQDKYLEELGQSLSGKSPVNPVPLSSEKNADAEALSPPIPFEPEKKPAAESEPVQVEPNKTLCETMNEPANRLPASKTESDVTTVTETTSPQRRASISSNGSLSCSEETSQAIHEAASALDLDPEYVLEKGMQAVLRMVARNGNRMTFPLEVKHIESIG